MGEFRQPVQAGGAVLTLAVGALLLGSGNAAAQSADATVVDSCETTLKDQDGQVLAIDLRAAVNSSEVLGLSLGSGTGLLPLSLEDVLDQDDVNAAGAEELVVNTAGEICDTSQASATTLTELLQATSSGSTDPTPESPAPESTIGESGDSGVGVPENHDPASGPADPDHADTEDVTEPEWTAQRDSESTSAAVPPSTPATVVDSEPVESESAPDPERQDAHVAQAVSDPEVLGSLPLLLAVTALMLVSSALVRTWLRRERM